MALHLYMCDICGDGICSDDLYSQKDWSKWNDKIRNFIRYHKCKK